jgi:hypothetical protein
MSKSQRRIPNCLNYTCGEIIYQSNIAAARAEVVKGYRLNKLKKTGLGNLQQRLRRHEGFSASLDVPNYRQDWADAYENKRKERKEG